MWREILALLAALSADPVAIDAEPAKAAAAVAVARSSMAREAPPPPAPPAPPKPGDCCSDCRGTGRITHPDGHTTPCPCPADCKCKRPKAVVRQPGTGRVVCEGGVCYWIENDTGLRFRVIGRSEASPAAGPRSTTIRR